MNQDRATQLLESIERKLREESHALEKEQEENESEEKKIQNDIDSVRETKVCMEHEVEMKHRKIQDNRNEITKIKNKIEDVS